MLCLYCYTETNVVVYFFVLLKCSKLEVKFNVTLMLSRIVRAIHQT